MSITPPHVAHKTRRTLASARSGASPPPRTFKCLKKASDATDATDGDVEAKDVVEVKVDGEELFNEDLD